MKKQPIKKEVKVNEELLEMSNNDLALLYLTLTNHTLACDLFEIENLPSHEVWNEETKEMDEIFTMDEIEAEFKRRDVPMPLGFQCMPGRILLKVLQITEKKSLIIIPGTIKKIDVSQFLDHPWQGYVVAMNYKDVGTVDLLDKVFLNFPQGDYINWKGEIYQSVLLASVTGIVY